MMNENIYNESNYEENYDFNFHIGKGQLANKEVQYLTSISDKFIQKDIAKKYDAAPKLAAVVKSGEQVFMPPELFNPIKKQIYKMIQDYVAKLSQNRYQVEKFYDELYWVVSTRAGDYNPLHSHIGTVAGVMYLKMPPKEEYKDAGAISFTYDKFSPQSLCFGGATLIRPNVGDVLLFPSWLTHTVYPFTSDVERRSIAFNMNLSITKI